MARMGDIKCPAAKQMVKYHYKFGTGLNQYHNTFMQQMRSLNTCKGYPTNCRNVAVSLGSLDAFWQQSEVDYDNNGIKDPMIPGAGAVNYVMPKNNP